MNQREMLARQDRVEREVGFDPVENQLRILRAGFRALEARYPEGLLRRVVRAGGRETEILARTESELNALAARVVTLFGAGGGAARTLEKRANERTAAAVTPSVATDDPNGPFAEIVVGGAGNLPVITVGGQTVTYAVVAGQRLQINVRRVKATGLTATGVIGQK